MLFSYALLTAYTYQKIGGIIIRYIYVHVGLFISKPENALFYVHLCKTQLEYFKGEAVSRIIAFLKNVSLGIVAHAWVWHFKSIIVLKPGVHNYGI